MNPTEQIFGGMIVLVILIFLNLNKIGKVFGWISKLFRNNKKDE